MLLSFIEMCSSVDFFVRHIDAVRQAYTELHVFRLR